MGLLPNFRVWSLFNLDTSEEVEGDFEAQDLTENVGATYGDGFALNSDQAVTQWLHGEVDTFSFTARLYDDSILQQALLTNMKFERAKSKLSKLKGWVKKSPHLGRPPLLLFSAGREISMQCILASLSNILYDPLTFDGAVRGVTMTVSLRRFDEFDLEAAAEPAETRYHRVASGEYYELIAEREYGRPLFGDVIRARHPEQPVLSEAQIVKLPSFEAIWKERVVPRSIALKGLTSLQDSPQRTLRQTHLDRLNRDHLSHIVPEGM